MSFDQLSHKKIKTKIRASANTHMHAYTTNLIAYFTKQIGPPTTHMHFKLRNEQWINKWILLLRNWETSIEYLTTTTKNRKLSSIK